MSPSSDDPESSTWTFVVRLWFEAGRGTDSGGEWRGQVREVPCGRTAYFRRLKGVVSAMKALTERSDDVRSDPESPA